MHRRASRAASSNWRCTHRSRPAPPPPALDARSYARRDAGTVRRLRQGAILVDAAANVLFINAAARTVLEAGDGLVLKGGCLTPRRRRHIETADRLLRASSRRLQGPLGGELEVRRGPRRPALGLVVTPLSNQKPGRRSMARFARAGGHCHDGRSEINPRRLAQDLQYAVLASLRRGGASRRDRKGDGREAAAKRRGISVSTAARNSPAF